MLINRDVTNSYKSAEALLKTINGQIQDMEAAIL